MSVVPLRAWVNRVAIVVAIIITFGIPGANLFVGYSNTVNTLAFKGRLNAARVAQYIYTHEGLWQYQRLRLAELIQLPEADEQPVVQTIFDKDGSLVLREGATLHWPVVGRRAPIVVSGETVGSFVIETDLWDSIINAMYATILSVMLGVSAYLSMRWLPLRALDRAIADLGASERALTAQNERFNAALSNMVQGLCMYDADGKVVIFSSRFVEIYRLPRGKIAVGMTTQDLMRVLQTYGTPDADPAATLTLRDAIYRERKDGAFVQRLTDGRSISITYRPRPAGGFVVTFEDITARLLAEERIKHMAHFDALTDLPNRVTFYERMEAVLAHLRRDESVGVLSLDLDNFKTVNDTLGHPVGDQVLKAVAERMQSCIRSEDLVARLGGDEFALVQVPAAEPSDLPVLAARLIEVVGAPYDIEGHRLVIGLSIGIAIAPSDGKQPDVLMKNADLALYRAKADGGGTYRFFEPAMDARMQARRALELDLRKAVLQGEFELDYQPIVDVKSGVVTSCEALVRWRHPERGLIQPMDFIPVAEETGLIVPIGEWVLKRACADAVRWPSSVMLSVNLSPTQFKNRNLLQSLKDVLSETGFPPGRLELEITELALLQESDGASVVLHQLRDLGIKIAMDDFGTGYSSLSYLRSFPFDKIKIDKSFVCDLPQKEDSVAIVRAVVGLSSSLGMTTIAEGVETKDQLASVKAEGCNEFQGFLFSRPKTAGEIEEILRAQATTAQNVA